jgi:predicted transcriptional regulator
MTPSQDILLVIASAAVAFTLVITGAGIVARTTKEYRDARTVVKAVITTYGEKLARQEETCQSISTELAHLRGSIEKLETHESEVSQVSQTTSASVELTQALKETSANIRLLNEKLSTQDGDPINQVQIDRSKETHLNLVTRGNQEVTATEVFTLKILATEGAKASTELHKRVGRSREHFARLMKRLYERGYVDRDTSKIPFTYRINENIARKVLETANETMKHSA